MSSILGCHKRFERLEQSPDSGPQRIRIGGLLSAVDVPAEAQSAVHVS